MSEVDDLRDGWKIIHQQMKEKKVTPDELARRTQHPVDRINKSNPKVLVMMKRDMLFL